MAWKKLILAALVVVLGSCGRPASDAEQAAALPSEGGPALWVTGDDDTRIYLFGTVHVLPPALAWRTAPLEAALAESGTIYFETDTDPDYAELQGLVARLGHYQAPDRLSNHLSADDFGALAEVSASLSVPVNQLEALKPWLVANAIGERLITQAGYDPMSGAERTLQPLAAAAGKEIRTLETVEQQLRVFADLPEDVQIHYLMDGVRNIEEDKALLGELVTSWARGDVDALARIMIEDDLASQPQIYDALLVNRNRNWVETLDTLTKSETGVFFIAVGAAHLAGDDSVQAMLTAKGYAVERLE